MSPLARALSNLSIQVEAYRLSPNSLPIGETVRVGNAEITFRQEGPALIIILYCRLVRANGLANSFREMDWLIKFVRKSLPEIKVLLTTVMAIKAKDSAPVPKPHKIQRFYCQYYKATSDGVRDGQQWLRLDL